MGSPEWGDGLDSETIAAVYYIKQGLESIGMDKDTLASSMDEVFDHYMDSIQTFDTQTCDVIIDELKGN